jgi:hypothetical protein
MSQQKLSSAQIEAVLHLEAPKRYEHFIKQAVAWRLVWGLWDEGWVSGQTSEGVDALPLWPAKEYASFCAVEQWKGSQAREISLVDLLDNIIPNLAEAGDNVGVFPTPWDRAVFLDPKRVLEDLEREMTKYE